MIPIDYCAEALINLALKPCLGHSLYHISVNRYAACTFGEVDEVFVRANGATPVGGHYRKVEMDDPKELAESFESRIGPVNPRLVPRALRLCSGPVNLNYLFDSSRLLEEGISAPPRFTDCLDVCVQSSNTVSIPAQIQWDFERRQARGVSSP